MEPVAIWRLRSLNDLANELRKRIDPILLRRTKAEVLSEELPEKHIHDGAIDNDPSLNIEIHLTPSQEDIYTQVRSRVQAGLARGKVLGEIQKLKIAHDHPRFLNPQERLNAANFDEVMAKESAKIDALERILDRVHARGEKATSVRRPSLYPILPAKLDQQQVQLCSQDYQW
jgi:SNF2 family DNA or RNA helicase